MRIHFDTDLDNLKRTLAEMSLSARHMIRLAGKMLFQHDLSPMQEIYHLERGVNQAEMDVDAIAVKLIALHQPAATDLRLIISVIKMSTQVERLGDLAINIAKRAPEIICLPAEEFPGDLETISRVAPGMVDDVMQAFLNHDEALARAVCQRDDVVDALNKNILMEYIRRISTGEIETEKGLEMIMISKQYERMADSATNIAEEIIFYIKGRNIKHNTEKTLPSAPPAS
ncbi:MAG TPA: phosphate signaling complex protein PhoU [Candidatus Sumerlaeota bacterium]|nr:phosphate signaling complex protein PhoU [Candidatus Sumerlaeota bacterium]